MITDEEIKAWSKERGNGMESAIGEYTPAEFWELLDAFVVLRAENGQHCEDFQAIANALGILDQLPDQAQVLACITALRARVAELKAERDRLRTLITPLVALADVLDSDEVFVEMRKPETWLMSLDEAVITSGDCFAARAALAGRKKP